MLSEEQVQQAIEKHKPDNDLTSSTKMYFDTSSAIGDEVSFGGLVEFLESNFPKQYNSYSAVSIAMAFNLQEDKEKKNG